MRAAGKSRRNLIVRRLATLLLGCLVIAGATLPSPALADEQVRPKVGLVLSGGGARGGAHVGVIRVLEELRIPVDYVAGTSMGALVGGLYASGMSADELVAVMETADWNALLTDRPPRGRRSFRRKTDDLGFLVDFDLGVDRTGLKLPSGLVQGQNLELALRRHTLPVSSIEDFDALPIPFRAVATDIATGDMVVFASGDLVTAMRASMSVPGIFRPESYEGRILVDGGVANNLPIGIVREMGADIVIAVDVGFPLQPPSELGSAVAITRQMLTILINSRARDQLRFLGEDGIHIEPALGDIGSQAFNRVPEAMVIGREAARRQTGELSRLSVSEAEYREWRGAAVARRAAPHDIERVVVRNQSRLAPEVVESRLTDQTGGPLDVGRLESDITDIYGFDTFEVVTYDVDEVDGITTLSLRTTEKSWGPNYLRFGINLEDDFDGGSNYNLAASLTMTELNRRGGEFRTELQVGESPRVFAEFYQPLDYASRWFVNPQFEWRQESTGLFDAGDQIAQFRDSTTSIALDVGRQFGNRAEARIGLLRARASESLRIGTPTPDGGTTDLASLTARLAYDTIDSIAIPRHGAFYGAAWNGFRESLGSDAEFDLVSLFLLKPVTRGRHTLLHWWDVGGMVSDEASGTQPFTLGGLFSLSGFDTGRFRGRHAGIGRLLYYRRMGDQAVPGLSFPLYLGASLEAGNVWESRDEIRFGNLVTAGSLFLVLDTLVGPLYLAWGLGEGGNQSAYLFLGQTF